jgi:hypothetical protein
MDSPPITSLFLYQAVFRHMRRARWLRVGIGGNKYRPTDSENPTVRYLTGLEISYKLLQIESGGNSSLLHKLRS